MIMPLMTRAFDPDYFEAWSMPQVISALAVPGTTIIGAMLNDEMLGFALSRTLFEECELLLIAVSNDARRLGIGARLVAEVLRRAHDDGANKVFLEVRVNNPAIGFYVRHHFSIVGHRRNYYRKISGELIDAQTMVVDIV